MDHPLFVKQSICLRPFVSQTLTFYFKLHVALYSSVPNTNMMNSRAQQNVCYQFCTILVFYSQNTTAGKKCSLLNSHFLFHILICFCFFFFQICLCKNVLTLSSIIFDNLSKSPWILMVSSFLFVLISSLLCLLQLDLTASLESVSKLPSSPALLGLTGAWAGDGGRYSCVCSSFQDQTSPRHEDRLEHFRPTFSDSPSCPFAMCP